MKKYNLILNSLIILIILTLTAQPTLAATFNPNFLISDDEMFSSDSMSWSDIQKFLDAQPGILKNLIIENYEGKKMEAAAIIYKAAKEHKINPKVILVKLQQEASLINNPTPKDTQLTWATGYAVCDDCNIWDPQVAIFGGFGQQVDYLARILRKYTDKAELYKFKVGDTIPFKDRIGNTNPPYDKQTLTTNVLLSNIATKNLYTYTPHVYTYFYFDDETKKQKNVGGNFNFWRIWNDWFGTTYPDGSILQIKANDPTATAQEKQVVWLIVNNQKRPFLSKAALMSSYNLNQIIYTDKKDLESYETGSGIKYPNYSILKTPDKKTYLLVNNKKRLISSPTVFKKIGFNPEEVVDIESSELDSYLDGLPINEYSVYPTGALLQDKKTGAVFYVESSLKQPIIAKEILKLNFPNKKIVPVSSIELDQYLTGDPLKLKDGSLLTVKGDPTVYVLSNGMRRSIASEKRFKELGYKKENIITVGQKTLEVHPLGDPIN